jgi:hypothetical protein
MKRYLLLPINIDDSLKNKIPYLYLYFDEIIFDTRIGFLPNLSLFDEFQRQYKTFKDKLFKEFDYEFNYGLSQIIEDGSIINTTKLTHPITVSMPKGYSSKEQFVHNAFQIQPRFTAALANIKYPKQYSTSLFGPMI